MNLAILITASRLIFPIFFSFFFLKSVSSNLYNAQGTWLLWAFSFLLLIEMSDALDGMIARGREEVTRFGKIFDPICDSIARQTVFCTFMAVGIIPLWFFLLFLYRDSFLSLLRIMNAIDGTVLAAKKSGKIKAVIQAIGAIFVVLTVWAHSNTYIPQKIWGMHPGFWIMLVPGGITILSFFDYFIPSIPLLKKMMIPEHLLKAEQ